MGENGFATRLGRRRLDENVVADGLGRHRALSELVCGWVLERDRNGILEQRTRQDQNVWSLFRQ